MTATAPQESGLLTRVHSRVLELIATGAPLSGTLEELVRLVEQASPDGVLASILLLDHDRRRLRHGAAPSLAPEYNAAIDGLPIGPAAGSCGTAAFHGRTVVVSNIESDPLWQDHRELAGRFGLRACWSTPIFGSDRKVIGTFANYYRDVRDPSPADRELTHLITRSASIAIEHERRRMRLEREVQRLQRLYTLTGMLGGARSLAELYEEGMSAVQDLLDVRRVSILLFDDDRVMRFKAWRGLSDEYRAAVEGHTPWTPEDVDARPIVVPDVAADPGLAAYGDVFAREQIAGLAFLPLRTSRVVGKFMAYFDQPRELSEDEIRAAEAVAYHMAIAVERARHEETLHRANAILSGIFEQTTDAVFVKDRDGRYVMVNSAAATVAGTEPASMIGRTAVDIFPAPVGEGIMQRDRILMSEGTTRTLEEPIVSRGQCRTFLSTKGAWRDANGEVVGLIGISRDITERKKSEEELRRRARQQAAIADLGVLALSDLELDDLTARAAALARELLEADFGLVSVLAVDGAESPRRASSGEEPAGLAAAHERLTALALGGGAPVAVPDFAADERLGNGAAGSGIAVAIRGAAQSYGVISAVGRAPRELPPDDAYCLQSLANILGTTIERRAIAAASRESEERFRSLCACSPTGIFLTDTQGFCSYTNASCQEICGFTEQEAFGAGWSNFVHPQDREQIFRAWTDAAVAARGFSEIFRFVHKDGSVRWTHVRTAPVIGDRAQLLGHVGTVEDINEAREMTEALRASEARYRSLVTATAQVVWRADADGMIDDMPDWRELTGQTADEVRGHGWMDAVHPDDRAAVIAATEQTAATRTPLELEFRLRLKDGTYRYMVDRAVPVLNEDGSVREWVGTCSDIDERRHGVESIALLSEAGAVLGSSLVLDEMLARLAALLLARGADFCAIALGGEESLTMRHLAHRTLSRQAIGDLQPLAVVRRVISSGRPELLTAGGADGDAAALQHLGIRSAMVLPLTARSRVIGALVIASGEAGQYGERDLTVGEELAGRTALAIDNAVLYAEAQAASRAKDEFLATLSHELRTPMTAILGWTRMLQVGVLDEETQRVALQAIQHSTRAQAQMIEDILDVSRIITGKMTIEPKPMHLAAVIEAALKAVRPAAAAKQIAVQVDLPPARRKMTADPNRLQQVVWNLVSNAIKFTPPHGRVEVRAAWEADAVTIVVADTGEGMPPELLPHVFERFHQADSSSTRAHGGLGLGLAIVRHLIELHGGTVTAQSPGRGEGSTFTVRLPLRASAAAVTRRRRAGVADTASPRLPSLRQTRVLVVDDEEQTRTFLQSLLTRCGADVRVSGSVEEALSTIDGWVPHVLVSDLAMPAEDGYSLMARLKLRESPEMARPVAIALTAYGRPEDRDRALSAGFEHFVQKPIDPVDFARLVAASRPRRTASRTDVRSRVQPPQRT